MSSITNGMPKTLVQVFDKPLINHLLQNCINAGIKDAVIVTGHNESMIREHLSYNTSDINIEFIYNKNWKLENGVSVLAAKDAIPNGEDFLLSMSDHYYKFDLLNKIIKSDLTQTVANVGADYKVNSIHDPDDAMKLVIDPISGIIGAMSKHLANYNAVDCGVFKCGYEFFLHLEAAKEEGSCSLSDACNRLIENQSLGGVDIKDSEWLDIDTPDALDYCHKKLKST